MKNTASKTTVSTKNLCRSPFKIGKLLVMLIFVICALIVFYKTPYKPGFSINTFTNMFTGGNETKSKADLNASTIYPSGELVGICKMCYLQKQGNSLSHMNLTTNSTSLINEPRCIMSINYDGRLGNNMGQYATLIALARWNQRPAFMLPEMAKTLRAYFDVSMPVMSEEAVRCLSEKWTHYEIHDWMIDEYRSLNITPEKPVMIKGYPCSWTFFDHIRQEIQREFRLHTHIVNHAQEVLRSLVDSSRSATFVGVHVRRTDYIDRMKEDFVKGVVADTKFFEQAMDYYRSQYKEVIFVVASDDMEWCRKNINNSLDDVRFAGSGNLTEPIHDFALLTQCNHSIITVGTFGFWIGYLTGGDVVYLANYLMPDSGFFRFFRFADAYLPSWKSINADLSEWVNRVQDKKRIKNK